MNNDNEKNKLNLPFGKDTSTKKEKPFSLAKIKGGSSFTERLKNISKRDIGFFIIGVSILILAPVAEYFLSKPQPQTSLTAGFGERRPSVSAGIYEPGINALSAGSPDGMEEVIAPLAARDPSSLILGLKKDEPPPPVYIPPQETKRDSIADLGKKAFSDATKSSPAPFIPPKMSASLRGAASFFGGDGRSMTTGGLSSGKILQEAKSASAKAQSKTLLGAKAGADYKGVASISDSVNKGAYEKLKTQADKSAGFFSGANAKEALEQAAAAAITPQLAGSGGLGSLQDGGRNTFPGGSGIRNSWSFSPGDPCRGSIQAQLACENARKANEFKNWLKYDLPKYLIQQAVDNIVVKGLLQPVGEKVANTTKSMLNPQPPYSPPPQKYCFTAPGRPGIPVSINKDNNGHVQLVPPVSISDCPCGYLTTQPYPECSGGEGSGNSGGSGGGSSTASSGSQGSSGQTASTSNSSSQAGSSSQSVDDIRNDLQNYDALLKKAIESAKKGELATKVGDLKSNSQAVAESLEQAGGVAQSIADRNVAKIDSNNFKKASEYGKAIAEVADKVRKARSDYDKFYSELISFKNTLKKAKGDYQSGKIKPVLEKGVVAETLGGGAIIPKLDEAIAKVKEIESETKKVKEEYLTRFEKRLNSHNAAYSWYVNQIRIAKEANMKVKSELGSVSGIIASAKSQISSIPDNAADEASINSLKQAFSMLTGLEAKNVAPQQGSHPTASTGSSSFRMSPTSGGKVIEEFIKWRSADKDQAWAGNISDEIKVKEENDKFESAKPSAKLSKGEYPSSFTNLSLETSFVVSLVRAMNVDKDIEVSKNLVANILEGIDGFETLMQANRTKLFQIEEELKPLLSQLKPVTQPKPSSPKPTTSTPKPTTSQQPVVNVTIVNQVNANANANSGIQVQQKK